MSRSLDFKEGLAEAKMSHEVTANLPSFSLWPIGPDVTLRWFQPQQEMRSA